MARFLTCWFSLLILCQISAYAQTEPDWFKEMNAQHPNFFKVQDDFDAYYLQIPFKKDRFTQAHKRWVQQVERFVLPNGEIAMPTENFASAQRDFDKVRNSNRGLPGWEPRQSG